VAVLFDPISFFSLCIHRLWIANPDLPERFKRGAALNKYDRVSKEGVCVYVFVCVCVCVCVCVRMCVCVSASSVVQRSTIMTG